MKKTTSFILLLLLSTIASASTITDINLWIGNDGVTWIEEKIFVEGENLTSSSIMIPDYINNVTVFGPEGRLNYSVNNEGRYNRIEFYFKRPLEIDELRVVWVKFSTPLLTVKAGGNWSVGYYTHLTPNTTVMRINFPVGSKIISFKPEDVLRSYDKYAIWLYPQKSELEFYADYEFGGVAPPTTLGIAPINGSKPGNESSFLPSSIAVSERTFFAVMLVIALAIGGAVYYIARKRGFSAGKADDAVLDGKIDYGPPHDFVAEPSMSNGNVSYSIESSEKGLKDGSRIKESILKMLDDKELAIVKLLEKSDAGEVTQAYVYKTTGIPKTSLSDIIRRMENRNIIESKKEGRLKWIKLKNWVLE